jgi:hypothetical protein
MVDTAPINPLISEIMAKDPTPILLLSVITCLKNILPFSGVVNTAFKNNRYSPKC